MPECEFHEGEDALDCRECEAYHEDFSRWLASIYPGVKRATLDPYA